MKRGWLWALPGMAAVIIFNLIFFLTGGGQRPAGVWVAYGFIHIACALLLFSAIVLESREKEAVLSIPLRTISNGYFAVTFLVSAGLIVFAVESVKVNIITEVILLGIYLVALSVYLAACRSTSDQEERRAAEMHFVRDTSARIQVLMEGTRERERARKLESVYDFLRSSPVRSGENVTEHELEVIRLVGELEKGGANLKSDRLDIILEKIMYHAKERNRILKNAR